MKKKNTFLFIFCYILFTFHLFSQIQIGNAIDGEAVNDQSGYSVSLSADGSIVAIGAPYNDDNGTDSGHVRVYQNINSVWTQIGNDINANSLFTNSSWSISLSADGSIVAIAAIYADGNGIESGQVKIYQNINSVWTQIGNDINGEDIYDLSGYSISLNTTGNIIAIGATRNSGNGNNSSGHVRVYENINSVWTQIGSDINGETAFDSSGYSVSLSSDGTIVAIGAHLNDGNGRDSGHVRVYNNINSVWTQIGSDIDGETAFDLSGYSVSLSSDGTIVAIGAERNSGNGNSSGHVRVYENINSVWTQIGSDIDGEAAFDSSGYSVSLNASGNIVAIGAIDNNGGGSNSGHVRIYKNISNSWTQIGSDIDGEAASDQSGYSVSLSADGSIIAIGAPFNSSNGSDSGHTRIFTLAQWTGNIDNDWHNTSNWLFGSLPEANNYAVVPANSTNFPTANSAVTIKNLEIKSGASFITSSTFTGDLIYQRNIPSSNWHFISSPVIGQNIDEFVASIEGGLQTGTQSNNIGLGLSYNPSSNRWTYLQSGASGTGDFISGQGYTINLSNPSGDVSFIGSMLTDNLTPINLTTTGNGYNLLGNPYPSYLNASTLLTDNTSVLETQTIWVWNQENGIYDTKITLSNFKIAPAQSFFVQSDGESGSLSINESYQSHETTDTFQKNSNTEIKLYLTDSNNNRDATIYFRDGATTGFDNGLDGELFSGTNYDFILYSELVTDNQGKKYQIQSLPKTDIEATIIPLGVIAQKNTEITITADVINLPENIKLFIEDKLTNSFIRLDEADSKFTIILDEDINDIGRFYLHTTTSNNLNTETQVLSNVVNMYSLNDTTLRVTGTYNYSTLKVFNVLGSKVLDTSFQGKNLNDITLPNLKSGLYIFQLKNNNSSISKKLIIK